MNQYAKKPIISNIYKWNKIGDHEDVIEMEDWALEERNCLICGKPESEHGLLQSKYYATVHKVCPGDLIIEDFDGECYPCKIENAFKTIFKQIGSACTNDMFMIA